MREGEKGIIVLQENRALQLSYPSLRAALFPPPALLRVRVMEWAGLLPQFRPRNRSFRGQDWIEEQKRKKRKKKMQRAPLICKQRRPTQPPARPLGLMIMAAPAADRRPPESRLNSNADDDGTPPPDLVAVIRSRTRAPKVATRVCLARLVAQRGDFNVTRPHAPGAWRWQTTAATCYPVLREGAKKRDISKLCLTRSGRGVGHFGRRPILWSADLAELLCP